MVKVLAYIVTMAPSCETKPFGIWMKVQPLSHGSMVTQGAY